MSDQTIQTTPECFCGFYRGKRVLVTGHTGFKGSWLCEWLVSLGAQVIGCSLPPPLAPNLFGELRLEQRLKHVVSDIRDVNAVQSVIKSIQPDIIFHLAAQTLVRLSYVSPIATFATNVMGTAHVLEAVRLGDHPCTVICVSSDKCYENKEWAHGYREDDPMGGYDPYSSSKGAVELLIAAYRRSFFSAPRSKVRLASARAGNVIGGGDWAVDRILPDCIRALQRGDPIWVRNKAATRPWQHVLEPLSGYLWLGATLSRIDRQSGSKLESAFNFGPNLTSNRSVADLVQEVLKHWPGRWEEKADPNAVHEASYLNLATDKAYHSLGWKPVWNFAETVAATVNWYQSAALPSSSIADLTRSQISAYVTNARSAELPWAR